MNIIDFSNIKFNNEMYGGQGGKKYGFFWKEKENWFLKLPQNITGQKGVKEGTTYSNSPVSEYIGSQIYTILGFEVHETMLGIYKDKVVCACKDFREKNDTFFEMNNLLNNTYESKEIEEELEKIKKESFDDEKTFKKTNLEELLFLLKNGTYQVNNYNLVERFWSMFVIDSFISNQDRHNGNWGIIKNDERMRIAPIFDNDASFFPKTNEDKFTEEMLEKSWSVGDTPYSYKGKGVNSRKIIETMILDKENKKIEWALAFDLIKNVPKIKDNIDKIKNIIEEIPTNFQNIEIISEKRKFFYSNILDIRLEKVLMPSFEKATTVVLDFINNIDKFSTKEKKEFIFSIPSTTEIIDKDLALKLKKMILSKENEVVEMIKEKTLDRATIHIEKKFPNFINKNDLRELVEMQIFDNINGILKETTKDNTIKELQNNCYDLIYNTLSKEKKYEIFDDNKAILKYFENIENFEGRVKKKDIFDLKYILETQEELEKNNLNKFSSEYIFEKVSSFLKEKTTDVSKVPKYLKNVNFQENFIDYFQEKYKIEINQKLKEKIDDNTGKGDGDNGMPNF